MIKAVINLVTGSSRDSVEEILPQPEVRHRIKVSGNKVNSASYLFWSEAISRHLPFAGNCHCRKSTEDPNRFYNQI